MGRVAYHCEFREPLYLQEPRIWTGTSSCAALPAFRGVKRRMEIFGEHAGFTLVDDFAHHPVAVRATLGAARARFPDRPLFALFEPRTNTTRRNFFQTEYGIAFNESELLLVAPVHRADSVTEEERFDPERLVADARSHGVQATLCAGVDHIIDRLTAESRKGDIVLILSNGGAIAFDELVNKSEAIVEAFNPGFGSRALADLLFGKGNTWGKLPITLYPASYQDQISIFDFGMRPGPSLPAVSASIEVDSFCVSSLD